MRPARVARIIDASRRIEKGVVVLEFLTANWPWMAVVVVMVVAHRRCCGGHHRHAERPEHAERPDHASVASEPPSARRVDEIASKP